MILRTLSVVATVAASCVAQPASGPPPAGRATPPGVTLVNPEFLDQFAATYRFRLGTPRSFTVTPDGNAVLFLRSGPRSFVQDLFVFDVATGQERPLLTADQVLAGGQEHLTAEELARRERMRMASRGIAGYDLSDDGTKVLVPLSGRLFVIDLPAAMRGEIRPVEIKSAAGFPIDPQFSPDATKLACVRDGEVYVTDLASGKETRITSGAGGPITHGEAEFVAQEEMSRFHGYWWSPEGAKIAYQRTDTAGMEMFHIADPVNPNAEPRAWPYPRAGKQNADVRLGIVPVAGGETVWVNWDRAAYPYLATVTWSKHAPLTILVQNRAQTEQVLYAVDDATGSVTELLREKDEAWLNIAESCPKWTDDGRQFLWLSEQAFNGCDHWTLQLRNRDGSLVKNLVGKNIGLIDVVSLDSKDRQAVVVATGGDPTQTHLYRVSIDDPKGFASMTQVPDGSPGTHGATFGKGHNTWVHSSSLLNGTQAWMVQRADGTTAGRIVSAAEEPPFLPRPEIVKTRGRLAYHAAIIRPRDFDPAKQYPVIDSVYGGPGSNTVTSAARAYVLNQWLADQGFIVVSIDGRGTPRRGRAWERVTKFDVISIPLADHVEALRELASKDKSMDLARCGITGWSFGGYFSAHATMQRPDVYKCGVAGAPVADWRDYDTHYTERYMGLPDEQPAAYDKTSVLTYCGNLAVPLLIIHGTADDNVYFMHSLKMTGALFRAGRPFEFLPLAGFTHSVPDPEVTRRLQTRVAAFFVEHLRR
jgi:dipeptidyl-peptidase-4